MIHYTIGIDEAGRGAWAGPVFAGAFAVLHSKFKKSSLWKLLADSKTLAEKQRNSIFTYIVAAFDTGDIAYGVGMSSASEIDSLGIKKANHLAMKRALTEILAHIPLEAHMVVQVDGRDHYTFDDILSHRSYEVHEYVRWDSRYKEISGASIIAKESRDRYMRNLDAEILGYGFTFHKGYGTAYHLAQCQKLGPCIEHRSSFAPIKNLHS